MNTTNDLAQLAQQMPAAAWHGITKFHALVVVIAGWVAHANWPHIIAAGTWVAEHGGVVGIGRALVLGKAPVANSHAPIANSQTK